MPVTHRITGDTCVITIDNPPVNVIGLAVREGLVAALDAAEAAGVARVVVTGAGRAFVAGADAREFDGDPVAPHLPDILRRLERLPAIAAINGAALGGGMEIALACRARIAHPRATLGLPEVTLGVVPGAGGTQRLPRLLGLAQAVALISEGRVVGADQALALGLVDALADDPLAAALALPAADFGPEKALCDRPAPAPDDAALDTARKAAAKRAPGQIAPQRAIDLVAMAAAAPMDQGLAAEREVFLTIRRQEQAAALRHLFFAERAATGRARTLGVTPAEVKTAVVVGGGTMGAAIAYALAGLGIAVTLVETTPEAAARARTNVEKLFDEAVKRAKTTAEQAAADLAARFRFVAGYDDLPPADIAIEAAFEDLSVKRAIFAALDAGLPQTTILATNTSYLDVNAIFAGIRAPGRCLGLHFFAPAHVMKLLEIVRAEGTGPATLATAFRLAERLRKIPVEAGVCDGFIGNRILTRYRQTTDLMLIEGALPAQIDTAMEAFGMAMGPYAVQDLSGLDIAYANRQRKNLRAQPGIRYVPIADRMVEDLKRLGRKTGAGWYDYTDGRRSPSPVVDDLVRRTAAEAGVTPRAFTAAEIADRALLAMIEEGLYILAEGIARRPADIDLVLVHGYAFPRWRGGPMFAADRLGLPAVLARLDALAAADPLSWRVPGLLRDLVAQGHTLASLNQEKT
ncbi:3-hydroxyacyl-CoA dehydrogenase NAD-binding domain-containing protein [Ruixingdingia sedimenti]|uniref:3-hydroxyacyl-CoA dehydrogenase NAD-binding domain-containing protein n=1 Tax=Ruixingdingia sedimenti TaxID=3073604 RepID=A0ABU1FA45_9RHOB|nr:3-hydroxyacyl-CoA dehydrogenase NAD-binding domain-containing protein [Xinfangfangia sp. LG-4]MDR5653761.1 3-hydroxyacyl-CoA dehydrogenase NAD-binding domain-containing protein [Xinfangfangia sp. LG-4]